MTDLLLPSRPEDPPTRHARGPQLDRRRAVVAMLVVGLAVDAAGRAGPATLAGAAAVVVAGVGLLVAGRARNRTAWLLVAGAAAVALWLPLRTSPWLLPFDVLAAGALLALAATYAHDGRLRDLTFVTVARRVVTTPCRAFQVPSVLGRMTHDGWRRRPGLPEGRGPELIRGLVLAVPVVAALAALLASADAVFASFFRIPFSPGSAVGHVALIGLGALGVAALLLEAAQPERDEPRPPPRIGTVETTVLLAGVVALYAAFAGSQAVVALRGADHVLHTSGLTYAEYARSGFFQLLAVAALTAVLLLGVRGGVRPKGGSTNRTLVVLAEATVALTLVIVGVALRRLAIYDDVFGLTMLRLSSTIVAWAIGGVFVLLGVAFAGVGRRHDWIAGGILTLAVLTLVTFNALDPEAVVVRHNAARDTSEVPVDVDYLGRLSDDAVPALEGVLADLDPAAAQATVDAICASGLSSDHGFLDLNRAEQRAAATRARLGC